MEEAPRQQQAHLKEIGPKKWFKNPLDSSFWVRIYTSLYIPHKDFTRIAMEATANTPFNDQVYFAFYVMNGLNIPRNRFALFASEDGILKIEIDAHNISLKNSTYVLVFAPKKIDGVSINEIEVRRKLDVIASILRTHTGINFMREIVYEGEVMAGEDKFSSMSEAIKLPHLSEGPHLTKSNWLQSKEIFDTLENRPEHIKVRVKLSLEYYTRALDEPDSFFLYWTSFEILCSGKSQTIKTKLKNCLDLKSLQEVENIGFGRIASWRHDFFHKGIRPKLTADIERYIQLVYLDLLRQELGLPKLFHVLYLIKAAGYDLSPIGLENRLDKQGN